MCILFQNNLMQMFAFLLLTGFTKLNVVPLSVLFPFVLLNIFSLIVVVGADISFFIYRIVIYVFSRSICFLICYIITFYIITCNSCVIICLYIYSCFFIYNSAISLKLTVSILFLNTFMSFSNFYCLCFSICKCCFYCNYFRKFFCIA